jgi:hypothetical protein
MVFSQTLSVFTTGRRSRILFTATVNGVRREACQECRTPPPGNEFTVSTGDSRFPPEREGIRTHRRRGKWLAGPLAGSVEDGMEPGNVVNLGTAVLALAALIVFFRMFRGDLSDNKGGMAFAVVVLAGLAYFIRTDMGRGLVDQLFTILR